MESTGQAKAEAQSRAEAARIEGEAAVQQAKLKAQASTIEAVRNCFWVSGSKIKLLQNQSKFSAGSYWLTKVSPRRYEK